MMYVFNFNNEGELIAYIQENIISTAEAAEILKCSRQYIEKLVREGKLRYIKKFTKHTVFLKSDVEERLKVNGNY